MQLRGKLQAVYVYNIYRVFILCLTVKCNNVIIDLWSSRGEEGIRCSQSCFALLAIGCATGGKGLGKGRERVGKVVLDEERKRRGEVARVKGPSPSID